MSQHTPGPWTIEADGAGWYIESNLISTFVASVADAKWNDNEEGDVVPTEEEQEANARLIAAAPDLLKALQATVDELIDAGFGASPYGLTKASIGIELGLAAIAKAKGAA